MEGDLGIVNWILGQIRSILIYRYRGTIYLPYVADLALST